MYQLKYITVLMLFVCCFVTAQNWHADIKTASRLASKENKSILLVFSGSDWCAPCIKLDKRVWQSDVFKKFSQDKLTLLKADFPRKKANRLPEKQQELNRMLAEKYNPKGYFPFILLLDKDGNKISVVEFKSQDAATDVVDRIKLLLN